MKTYYKVIFKMCYICQNFFNVIYSMGNCFPIFVSAYKEFEPNSTSTPLLKNDNNLVRNQNYIQDKILKDKDLTLIRTKLDDIDQGNICGVCEKYHKNLEKLENNNISSIDKLKFCPSCRLILGDGGNYI